MPNAMLTAPPSERFLAVDGRLEKRALGATTSQHKRQAKLGDARGVAQKTSIH
jgi:hypothetical protein